MSLYILRVLGGEKTVEGNTRGDSLRPGWQGPVPWESPSPAAHYASSTPSTPGVIL